MKDSAEEKEEEF